MKVDMPKTSWHVLVQNLDDQDSSNDKNHFFTNIDLESNTMYKSYQRKREEPISKEPILVR